MKNYFFLFLTFIVGVCSLQAQRIQYDSIQSKKLNQVREIAISLPPSYGKEKDRKYPILLVLDQEYLMPLVVGNMHYANYWEDLPDMIIVGVSQNRGYDRDLDMELDKESSLPIKQGAKFFEFIGQELIPGIEKQFGAAAMKIAVGHDVSAAFLNTYLYKENPLFDGYILISPEMPSSMGENVATRLKAITKPIFYYTSTADGDVRRIRESVKAFGELLKDHNKPSLNFRFDEFQQASHYSQVTFALPAALYQFFGVYQPISIAEFNDKIAKLESGYVKYLEDKYAHIEQQLGMKMKIRLSDFKAIEAAILKNKAYNEFEDLSVLANKHYPKSMLGDYHQALMYENKGDYSRAIKSYMRAYGKEPIGDITKELMLDRADELKRM